MAGHITSLLYPEENKTFKKNWVKNDGCIILIKQIFHQLQKKNETDCRNRGQIQVASKDVVLAQGVSGQ